MAIFDVANPAHLALLPPVLHEHAELPAVASEVEYDAIAEYTRYEEGGDYSAPVPNPSRGFSLGDGRYVYLRGYHTDEVQMADALKVALRFEIAAGIRWRIRRRSVDPARAVDMQVTNRKNIGPITHRAAVEEAWPTGWGRRLEPFDSRPAAWAI